MCHRSGQLGAAGVGNLRRLLRIGLCCRRVRKGSGRELRQYAHLRHAQVERFDRQRKRTQLEPAELVVGFERLLKAPFGEERQFIATGSAPMRQQNMQHMFVTGTPLVNHAHLSYVLDFYQRWRSLDCFR